MNFINGFDEKSKSSKTEKYHKAIENIFFEQIKKISMPLKG